MGSLRVRLTGDDVDSNGSSKWILVLDESGAQQFEGSGEYAA